MDAKDIAGNDPSTLVEEVAEGSGVADTSIKIAALAPVWPGPDLLPEKPPFYLHGRDFSYPNYEAAMLSLLLNRPESTKTLLDGLTPEHFFEEHNFTLYECIIRLHNEGVAVSAGAVLKDLAEINAPNAADWISYVDAIAAVFAEFKKEKRYKRALLSAIGIRGAGAYSAHSYDEALYAELLRSKLENVRCVGARWFKYEDGRSVETSRDIYRNVARECIHPNQRQHKRVLDLLGLVESSLQVAENELCGAYKSDGDRILINAANGVVVVHASEGITLLDHSPTYGFTLKLQTAYDAEATCPLFDRVISEALHHHDDQHLLQCFAGYILHPTCQFEVCLVGFGHGQTGKSTIAEALRYTLGDDLCSYLPLETLCSPSSYSVAKLEYKMLNLASELKATEVGESSAFKALISGETLDVREIYRAPRAMRSGVKLMFLSNHLPRFRNGTHAELRRMRLLHFKNQPREKDLQLKWKLRTEAAGILNWMLEGLLQLLAEPEMPRGGFASQQLLGVFAKSNDPVGRFVAECCEFHPGGEVNKQVLFAAFVEWCHCNGTIVTEHFDSFFYRTLRERFPELKYVRRRFGARRKEFNDPEKCRMVQGIRISKQLKPQSVADAVESKRIDLGCRAIPLETPDLRDK